MRDYACIMLNYEQPEFIKEIQKTIPEDDVYQGETQQDIDNHEYGLESNCHLTICYGLENDVKFDDLKQYLFPLDEYKTILINISIFENELFDVLKVDARCPKAAESNKSITDNFEVHSDFDEYKPHMTIAYLKKGKADKYKKDILDKIDTIKPKEYYYSYFKDGKDVDTTYKKL